MKLNVEVDSGAFEKVIEDGINALSKEDLGNIIKQVVYEAFTKCETFKDMLIIHDRIGWSGTESVKIGPLAAEAIKSVNMDEELAEFKKTMVKALMENHQKIVEDMFLKAFIDKIVYEGEFYSVIKNAVMNVLSEHRNGKRSHPVA